MKKIYLFLIICLLICTMGSCKGNKRDRQGAKSQGYILGKSVRDMGEQRVKQRWQRHIGKTGVL